MLMHELNPEAAGATSRFSAAGVPFPSNGNLFPPLRNTPGCSAAGLASTVGGSPLRDQGKRASRVQTVRELCLQP